MQQIHTGVSLPFRDLHTNKGKTKKVHTPSHSAAHDGGFLFGDFFSAFSQTHVEFCDGQKRVVAFDGCTTHFHMSQIQGGQSTNAGELQPNTAPRNNAFIDFSSRTSAFRIESICFEVSQCRSQLLNAAPKARVDIFFI